MDGPHLAGIVPLMSTWGEPYSAADLSEGTVMPESVVALGGSDAHPA